MWRSTGSNVDVVAVIEVIGTKVEGIEHKLSRSLLTWQTIRPPLLISLSLLTFLPLSSYCIHLIIIVKYIRVIVVRVEPSAYKTSAQTRRQNNTTVLIRHFKIDSFEKLWMMKQVSLMTAGNRKYEKAEREIFLWKHERERKLGSAFFSRGKDSLDYKLCLKLQ